MLINFINMELFNFIARALHIQPFVLEEYHFQMLKPMITQ